MFLFKKLLHFNRSSSAFRLDVLCVVMFFLYVLKPDVVSVPGRFYALTFFGLTFFVCFITLIYIVKIKEFREKLPTTNKETKKMSIINKRFFSQGFSPDA